MVELGTSMLKAAVSFYLNSVLIEVDSTDQIPNTDLDHDKLKIFNNDEFKEDIMKLKH
jgi:hypothetical protein